MKIIINKGNACMNPGDSTDGSKTDATEKPGASTTPSNTESRKASRNCNQYCNQIFLNLCSYYSNQ